MCTLLWGKDTKEKTNNEEDVERVADEIPSELGGEADIIEAKASSSNLGGSNAPTPNYPKNHVKKIHPVYRGTNFT
eukprot:SAG11_NODE_1062_length_5998_cov_67.555518_1_plen_76_part_00